MKFELKVTMKIHKKLSELVVIVIQDFNLLNLIKISLILSIALFYIIVLFTI